MTAKEWATYHAELFGLTGQADTAMIATWCALFTEEGFSPEELYQSSRWMAVHDPPEFRAQHLVGLMARVKDQRREESIRNPPYDEREAGKCVLCAGGGFVSVPGAGCETHGGNRIPYESMQTVAVLCSCIVGRTKLASYTGKKSLRTLADYEREFPHWKEELRRLELLPVKRAEAHQHAMGLDKALGAIFARLRNLNAHATTNGH